VKLKTLHPWSVTLEEAEAIQRRLASQVSPVNELPEEVRCVAGVDISGTDAEGMALGAAVALSYPGLEVVEVQTAREGPGMEYVPGFLSFREVPVLAKALEALQSEPDILMVDGQGYAHPRRFGIACHLGLLTGLPTIGCAKSVLCGKYDNLGVEAGATSPLIHRGEVVGMAVRTRAGVSPVFVSVGYRTNLEASVRWVMACSRGYRIPEPTRLAHKAASGTLKPAPVQIGLI
jgi:deoxyribonuclease V